MPHFICDRCRQPLTPPLQKISLPAEIDLELEPGPNIVPADRIRAARMPRGTYAIHNRPHEWMPEPLGYVVHPDDVLGVGPHPDKARRMGCCGLAGFDGMNLVCINCGTPVATQQWDCFTQNQVVLDFAATRRNFAED